MHSSAPKDIKYVDREFGERFQAACDAHPLVPAVDSGRFPYFRTVLKNKFGVEVSVEAVRKWHAGLNRPRPKTMKHLAMILDVDEGFLSLGISPRATPSQQKVRNVRVGGAVNVVLGMLQLSGGSCAFPSPDDPNGKCVDFYVIVDGTQRMVSVALMDDPFDGEVEVEFVNEYARCSNIVVIPSSPTSVEMYVVGSSLIRDHGTTYGGHVGVKVSRKGTSLVIGSHRLPRVVDLVTSLAEMG